MARGRLRLGPNIGWTAIPTNRGNRRFDNGSSGVFRNWRLSSIRCDNPPTIYEAVFCLCHLENPNRCDPNATVQNFFISDTLRRVLICTLLRARTKKGGFHNDHW
jgi:hypothetical protein